MLLNSKDTFTFSVLLAGYDGPVKVQGRIVEVSHIRQVSQIEPLSEEDVRYRTLVQRRRALLREGKGAQWLFSLCLDVISGYGYRPSRTFFGYILLITGFAVGYFLLAVPPGIHLTWYEALVLSISSFHGRGFFQPLQSLGDPVDILAAIEAVFGLLIEITFIATFTQRFFGR